MQCIKDGSKETEMVRCDFLMLLYIDWDYEVMRRYLDLEN